MGKLKPIGSEKLTGLEKIQRMIQISRYNENIPSPLNETSSTEFSKKLPDGKIYSILKEKNGYVIKRTISESIGEQEYLEPLKNRNFYKSYSQAFKRLNLIVKEINSSTENSKNLSLFEAADEATKYILKFGETQEQSTPPTKTAQPQPPAPAAQPTTPQNTQQPSPEPQQSSPEPQQPTDEPQTEPDVDMETGDMESQDTQNGEEKTSEEPITFKTIQKLTGKLGQKIREFSETQEEGMNVKDTKYVINSILSALDLNSLSETDKEEIMSKFESTDMEGETSDNSPSDFGDESETEPSTNDGVDAQPTNPEPPQDSEMTESYDDNEEVSEKNTYKKTKEHEMLENLFSESKVEKVLQKYFDVKKTPKEIVSKKIRNLSENIVQEVKAKKIVEKYPSAKFLGKNNKNILVFEIDGSKLGVTKSGKII